MKKHRMRWAVVSLMLLGGLVVVSSETTGVPFVTSNGATAAETTIAMSSSSPSISITPIDSLIQPLLGLLSQTPPATPADQTAPQEEAPAQTEAPAAQLAPPPPPPPAAAPAGLAGEVLAAMNADRAANGLAPLTWNDRLAGIAQNWASTIAQRGSLTHQDMNAVLGQSGFGRVAENLLYGPGGSTAADMESMWMNSPGHRANILNPAYTAAGVGLAVAPDGQIWAVVEFGG